MSLETQVMSSMKDAMKSKDEALLRGLRAIKAEIRTLIIALIFLCLDQLYFGFEKIKASLERSLLQNKEKLSLLLFSCQARETFSLARSEKASFCSPEQVSR